MRRHQCAKVRTRRTLRHPPADDNHACRGCKGGLTPQIWYREREGGQHSRTARFARSWLHSFKPESMPAVSTEGMKTNGHTLTHDSAGVSRFLLTFSHGAEQAQPGWAGSGNKKCSLSLNAFENLYLPFLLLERRRRKRRRRLRQRSPRPHPLHLIFLLPTPKE